MKKLEVGCFALVFGLVVYTEDNGKVVKLFNYDEETDSWDCSGDVIGIFGEVGESNYYSKNLMRIDGEDFKEDENLYSVKDKDLIHV